MAQAERETLNGPSVDAMLRGLTERPNVQSTLILSRKDGSIIRATGLPSSGNLSSAASGTTYQWARKNGEENEGGDPGTQAQNQDGESRTKPKPLELLASSIFQFVNNASSLGASLGTASRNADGLEGPSTAAPYGDAALSNKDTNIEEDTDSRFGEDEVQLLRLRTKFQEIIIFPDSSYICCVVQKVGKAGQAADRR